MQGGSFPEGKLYEDTAVSYKVVDNAEKFVVNMEPKYYYIQRYTSTANGTSWKKYKYQFIEAGDNLADWTVDKYPDLSEAANVKRVFVRLSTLSQMVNSNYCDPVRVKEMRDTIMRYKKSVLKNPKTPSRDKFGVLAISLGWTFYKIVWRVYYTVNRRK